MTDTPGVPTASEVDGSARTAWSPATAPPGGAGEGDGAVLAPRHRTRWVPGAADAVVVVGVIAVVLWQMHLPLLLSNTSTAGGDTGAHYMMPAYFNRTLFPHLTGWDPAWYDGYPDYTFYFVLPDALIAIAAHLVPYNIAFKLGTVLGSVLLPVTAWALGRLAGLRAPIPAALAAATLPFLFDYTWTIYGGNLLSSLAGEYAFSFSVALLLLFLGLFARGIRTGRHRVSSALVLAACFLAHVVPGALAVAGAAFITLFELAPPRLQLRDDLHLGPRGRHAPGVSSGPARRPTRSAALWWGASTVGLGLLLAAWWLVPFLVREGSYSTSMNYSKVTTYRSILFPTADLWVLVLAGAGAVVALALRSRAGVLFAVLAGVSAVAVVADPTRSLYNVRFLPLWFLFAYLLAGWLVGTAVAALARWVRRDRLTRWALDAGERQVAEIGRHPPGPSGGPHDAGGRVAVRRPLVAPWAPGAVGGALVCLVAAAAVVVPPFVPALASSLPSLGIHPGANQVRVWADWNYTGYSGKADYPEYRALMRLMDRIGHTDGCGRAMWEYNANENRFGTPEALMLLPYWTTYCVDSMEGLLFESSATTPYHFINQAELSASPSEAVVGLPYGPLTVHLGVEHLQLLGVRYFMAASPQVQEEANADPTLKLLATSGPWHTTYQGQQLSTTWKVYEVRHSAVVTPLPDRPAVLAGVGQAQATWLGRIGSGSTMTAGPSLRWYTDPRVWGTELVAGGPPAWPRIGARRATSPPVHHEPAVTVSHIRQGTSSVGFDVSRTGTPVLVKISYFPNWHVSGALGPWRATPNLMVVVPTSRHVTLTYGTTAVTSAGDAGTLGGAVIVAGILAWAVAGRVRRRRARIG